MIDAGFSAPQEVLEEKPLTPKPTTTIKPETSPYQSPVTSNNTRTFNGSSEYTPLRKPKDTQV